ncbi:MAG TPA: acyltransferase [Stellaceae bacterium]|nr:acyltransferase [Stellaceae bacterium]
MANAAHTTSQKRLRGIDALRGIAALAVCLFHYTDSFPRTTGDALHVGFDLGQGIHGVDLFLVISGFVIFMTLEKSRSTYDFLTARVARLYPAFIVCLLVTTSVLYLSNLSVLQPTLGRFLANVSMVPYVFGQDVVDGVYWTLAYEAAFYVMAATVIRRCGLDRVELVCIPWFAMALVMRLWPVLIWHSPYLLLMARLATSGGYAGLFIMGIMLYRICAGQARVLTYFMLAVCLLNTLVGPPINVEPLSNVAYAAIMCAVALLVWLGGTNRFPEKLLWPLIFLGDISYSFYLLHDDIGFVMMNRLLKWGVDARLTLLVTFAFAVALSYAMNRLVERPGQRALRSFLARYRDRFVAEAWPRTAVKPLAGD